MMDPRKHRPPAFALGLLILSGALHFLFKPVPFVPVPYRWLGAVLFAAGLGVMVWAHQLFVLGGTPVRHSESPKRFIRQGPYRYSRNPMYVGGLLIFLGLAAGIGTWPMFLLPAGMFAVLDRIFIPWEEKLMLKLFGEEFRRYQNNTRRWL